jgi:SAM-dependent methyltransferase
MLRTARSRISGGSLVAADAELLPFHGQSFDTIITSSSFHFWPDPQHALIEIRRVLKKNGQLVITDWCDDFIACRICDAFLRWRDVSHQRIFSQTECRALLEDSGFQVLRTDRYKISWLWGLMTAVASAG